MNVCNQGKNLCSPCTSFSLVCKCLRLFFYVCSCYTFVYHFLFCVPFIFLVKEFLSVHWCTTSASCTCPATTWIICAGGTLGFSSDRNFAYFSTSLFSPPTPAVRLWSSVTPLVTTTSTSSAPVMHLAFQVVSTVQYFLFQSLLTLRWLTSYIYGAPILDVSRSHTTTQHSR